MDFSRRVFLQTTGLAVLSTLAGCATTAVKPIEAVAAPPVEPQLSDTAIHYAARPEEQFPLPAIPYQRIKPQFHRQLVDNPTREPAGTLVVDTGGHFLYFTMPNGRAMRYGVGLGKEGFEWAGRGVIHYKRKWPRWTPPDEMVARQPSLKPYSIANGGMDPGLRNPLGARALYIFKDREDTLYRIHGSPEWQTIGKSVSSGCVRMINQDVVDLFERVPSKTPIYVTDLSGHPLSV